MAFRLRAFKAQGRAFRKRALSGNFFSGPVREGKFALEEFKVPWMSSGHQAFDMGRLTLFECKGVQVLGDRSPKGGEVRYLIVRPSLYKQLAALSAQNFRFTPCTCVNTY
jgi:hypothetical protein